MKNTKQHAQAGIQYEIQPVDLAGHLFEVKLHISAPHVDGQILSLPSWIPGSYMIREFARNIVQIEARSQGRKVQLKKLDKQTWQAAPCKSSLDVTYLVYAWDLSVRAAHLDQQHAFFNGTSVFLRVVGQEQQTHIVDIQRGSFAETAKWRVATALPELKAKRFGFGSYVASNYDELVDHPVELAEFVLVQFEAHGIPHDCVFTGLVPNLDTARIAHDLKQICEAQIAFFEPRSKRAPMDRYVFMTMVTGDGYGGLEHRASTALLCKREDLPTVGHDELSEGYQSFLGLCSHEYFHTWNVKRIKPAVFADYDLSRENYTKLLWLFEGFTSYYDDLFLLRTGLIDEKRYFRTIEKTINTVTRSRGRLKQSVAESSFDAWTKYYRQDENSPNAIVSYYTKGSLVALGLDLLIRAQTNGQFSLDDVMRKLWQKFGKSFYSSASNQTATGLGEDEFVSIAFDATGVDVADYIKKFVEGTHDVPLSELYAPFGLSLASQNHHHLNLGAKTVRDGNDCKIANVFEGESARKAGLSAGDIIVAIDNLRVYGQDGTDQCKRILNAYQAGQTVQVHAFRRDELRVFKLKLAPDASPNFKLDFNSSYPNELSNARPGSASTKSNARKGVK